MGRYIVKRLLEIIPVLFIITFIVFFLVRLSGDPVNTMLPPEATPQDRQEMREALGLDKPVLEQYGIFLGDLVHGRFGSHRPPGPWSQRSWRRHHRSASRCCWRKC